MQNSVDCPLEICVTTVKQQLDGGAEFLLLDCRERDEYEVVHLEDARHIPMNELAGRLGELGDDVQQSIIVYCHHGGRSLMVAQWLRRQGYQRAQSMDGGIDAWSLRVDATKARY